MNPVIDLGQIQGAFMQGLGFVLREGMEWDERGAPLTTSHWDYKAPVAADVRSVLYAWRCFHVCRRGRHAWR